MHWRRPNQLNTKLRMSVSQQTGTTEVLDKSDPLLTCSKKHQHLFPLLSYAPIQELF